MPRSDLSKKMSLGLHADEWVEVRSKEEILATLDGSARMDGLVFQPEMLQLAGKRFRVAKTAHKTCDSSVHKTGGRKLYDTVHLEGGRCDGGLHDGCQADCVFFWKEAWLKRIDSGNTPSAPQKSGCKEQDVMRAAQTADSDPADPTWVCQTTSIHEASEFLPWWDARQYITDVARGNHGAWHMTKLLFRAGYRKLVGLGIGYRLLIAAYNRFQKMTGGEPYPDFVGKIPDKAPTPTESLNLRPGEWIEVKSKSEIESTITSSGINRGMRFDIEMLKYAGRRYRVQYSVEKIIHEKNGKMTHMKSPCIQLEKVYCRAECTDMRLGCPRASNTYWREIWLKRAEPPKDAEAQDA